jgi:outer membrane protein
MTNNSLLIGILLSAGSFVAARAATPLVGNELTADNKQHQPMTINQLFDRAEDMSKSLRTQKTGVEAAEHGIADAKSKRLPDINTTLSVSYIGNVLLTDRDFTDVHGMSSPHFGNSFSLEARQTIYSGGALTAGIRLAEMGKQQAEIGTRLTRNQVRFMALGQYLDLFKIDNRMKVYEKNIQLTEQLIANIREKQAQGMALKNDITRYELQMETLKLAVTTLRNNREICNHELCNTLGLSTDTYIQPDTTLTAQTYAMGSEAEWQNRATTTSPLLEQSALNIDMARQREKLAKSELLPKIAVVAADNFNGPITFELPPINKNLNVWYLGVGINYNLSSLFKSNKRVRQAAVETRQMQEAHALSAETLNNNMQQAYVKYRQTYSELATQQKSVELADQNYGVMKSRYLNQMALVTDMVDASNLLLNAELQEVDAHINIVYAYYRMKFVAGNL